MHLLNKRFVRRLWEETLLVENGHDAHSLLNQLDGWLKVEPKVDELPINALLDVLLLLENKHVVVEELLELLIGQIDAQLLKAIGLEDLKASNVETTDEGGRVLSVLQLGVDFVDHPLKQALVDRLGQGVGGVVRLALGHGGRHPFSPGFHSWFEDGLLEVV
eukprot:Lithocolla_globosa_v1_NODE_770_length_3312_cov_5.913417.p2 type:complete len:162 gc:universal NODE_770_length_3312_cov_5.913417:2095-2580(+)